MINYKTQKVIIGGRGCGKTFSILNYNFGIIASMYLDEPVENIGFLIYKGIISEIVIDFNKIKG